MNKLTIFTVILSITVVVVVAELMFDNVLTPDEGKVSVLSSQNTEGVHPSLLEGDAVAVKATKNEAVSDDELEELTIEDIEALLKEDIEKEPVAVKPREEEVEIDIEALLEDEEDVSIEILSRTTGKITNEALTNAGFPAAELVEASFDGNIYQTVDVSDLSLDITKNYVASKSEVFGAVYAFSVDERVQNELYRVLRERAAFGSSVEVNETNTFGDNSFYMNDARRESTAFLVIRSGNSFYALAYPKKFHKYFKPLAQNI